jgi:nucleoside phosphorylase
MKEDILILLVCATELEARPFIEYHKLEKQGTGSAYHFYEKESSALVVTGMGSMKGALYLSEVIQQKQESGASISKIVNYGIAGCLTDARNIGDVVEMNRVIKYSAHEFAREKPGSHFLSSFPEIILNTTEHEPNILATSDHPVFNKEDSQNAARYAQFVDMESYGYAFVANHYAIPIKVFKGISDYTFKESETSFKQNVHRTLENLLSFHREQHEDK